MAAALLSLYICIYCLLQKIPRLYIFLPLLVVGVSFAYLAAYFPQAFESIFDSVPVHYLAEYMSEEHFQVGWVFFFNLYTVFSSIDTYSTFSFYCFLVLFSLNIYILVKMRNNKDVFFTLLIHLIIYFCIIYVLAYVKVQGHYEFEKVQGIYLLSFLITGPAYALSKIEKKRYILPIICTLLFFQVPPTLYQILKYGGADYSSIQNLIDNEDGPETFVHFNTGSAIAFKFRFPDQTHYLLIPENSRGGADWGMLEGVEVVYHAEDLEFNGNAYLVQGLGYYDTVYYRKIALYLGIVTDTDILDWGFEALDDPHQTSEYVMIFDNTNMEADEIALDPVPLPDE